MGDDTKFSEEDKISDVTSDEMKSNILFGKTQHETPSKSNNPDLATILGRMDLEADDTDDDEDYEEEFSEEDDDHNEEYEYNDDEEKDDDEGGTPEYITPEPGVPTPFSGRNNQPVKDEQTVNVFLLAFLSALTASSVPFHTRWVAERNTFVYENKVRFVAKTDGHLRDCNGETRSLIEVKSRRRVNDVQIRVQESAQMAAWIKQTKLNAHDHEKDCK